MDSIYANVALGLQPVRLVCRKPTSAEIAAHQAAMQREVWRTGLLWGIEPTFGPYLRRRAAGDGLDLPLVR